MVKPLIARSWEAARLDVKAFIIASKLNRWLTALPHIKTSRKFWTKYRVFNTHTILKWWCFHPRQGFHGKISHVGMISNILLLTFNYPILNDGIYVNIFPFVSPSTKYNIWNKNGGPYATHLPLLLSYTNTHLQYLNIHTISYRKLNSVFVRFIYTCN